MGLKPCPVPEWRPTPTEEANECLWVVCFFCQGFWFAPVDFFARSSQKPTVRGGGDEGQPPRSSGPNRQEHAPLAPCDPPSPPLTRQVSAANETMQMEEILKFILRLEGRAPAPSLQGCVGD